MVFLLFCLGIVLVKYLYLLIIQLKLVMFVFFFLPFFFAIILRRFIFMFFFRLNAFQMPLYAPVVTLLVHVILTLWPFFSRHTFVDFGNDCFVR